MAASHLPTRGAPPWPLGALAALAAVCVLSHSDGRSSERALAHGARAPLGRWPQAHLRHGASNMAAAQDEAAGDIASGAPVAEDEGLVRVQVPLGPGKGNLSLWQDAEMADKVAGDALRPISNAALLLSKSTDAPLAFAMKGAPDKTALAVWPAGTFLGQFLVNCPSFVRGKSVVELGCGVGIAGICAGRAGAREVLFTDLDPVGLDLAGRNAAESAVPCPVSFAAVDWLEEATWPEPLPPCDVVLAADVLHFQEAQGGLVRFLDALLPDDGRALICDPRKRLMRPGFVEMCEDAGLEISTLFETPDMVLLNVMRLVAPE